MAAYKYSYGTMGGLFKNPPEVAGKVFEELQNSETGLTAKSLVDASRDESAPLHNEFEWDDTIAAEKYREEQATCMIRHLVIVRTDIEEVRRVNDRAFVFTGSQKTGYVPLKEALVNKQWRENLLKSAHRDMQYFVNKYERLEELANVIVQMKQILSHKDAV